MHLSTQDIFRLGTLGGLALAAALTIGVTALAAQANPSTNPAPDPKAKPDPAARALIDTDQPLSFSAVFDRDRPIILEGTLIWVDLRENTSSIFIKTDKGVIWRVEGGSMRNIAKNGFTEASFKPGQAVLIRGYQSKDAACSPVCLANGRDVTSSDGVRRFLGSSSAGNPNAPSLSRCDGALNAPCPSPPQSVMLPKSKGR